jgi:hypothetical protein
MRCSRVASTSIVASIVMAVGCARSGALDGTQVGIDGGAQVAPGSSDSTTGSGTVDSSTPPMLLTTSAPEAGADSRGCVTSCSPNGGRYCGSIGNRCQGTLACGACPANWICQSGLCVGDSSCTRGTCRAGSSQYCGMVGDGCGGAIDCGTCDPGKVCNQGLCADPGCVPATCSANGITLCGDVGDGCGGSLACGDCPGGATCGGGGIPHICPTPNCTPVACNAPGGGIYCGDIGDGCGGLLKCGNCPGGVACGVDAPNLCQGTGGAACTGIACQVAKDRCAAASPTRLSGTVYDPAGQLPLYNAVVYVPNAPLDPVPEGASCDKCNATLTGTPITTALTDVAGHFQLNNVPSGPNVPLVIQVGRWRREVTVPNVTKCVDNPIADRELTRLPRSQAEGHIPRIAITTGGSDALECMLRRFGIADQEFTADTGTGRVNLYVGGEPTPAGNGRGTDSFTPAFGGGAFPDATTLWSSPAKLQGYDIVVYSCEGGQYAAVKAPYVNNFLQYVNEGGRAFLSHLHFYWLRSGAAELQKTANYIGVGPKVPDGTVAQINATFPKGAAFSAWLQGVGATTTPGQIALYGSQQSVTGVVPPTQEWIYFPQNPGDTAAPKRRSTQYLSFNTPVPAAPADKCGRVVLTDIHVKQAVPAPGGGATLGGDDSDPTKPFPSGCAPTAMSPQGKALEFLFFDLSACIQPDTSLPTPPPPTVPAGPPPPATAPPPAPPPPPPAPPPPPQ